MSADALSWDRFAARTGAAAGLLVLAPHPDDETLGCGGLVTIACRAGVPVHVAYLTDGAASHPGSRAWPPARLTRRRREEARRALHALGVHTAPVFLGLPDGGSWSVPPDAMASAAARLTTLCRRARPGLLVTTWRREPHGDHRTAYALARQAADECDARLGEFLVWTGRLGTPGDAPRTGEACPVTLDVRAALASRRRALAAHESQLGRLVADDPDGFVLTAQWREAMLGETETYWC